MHISKAHDYQPAAQALLVLLLLLLFSSELLAAGCRPARVAAGEHQGCLQVKTAEGAPQSRNYRLYIPKHYDAKADMDWPLLVVLHGGGGNPKAISRYSRLNSIARKQFDDDWIILYPEGLDRGWNDSRQRYTQDDVEFITELVSQHLPQRLGIHAGTGYYVTGISNGALMAMPNTIFSL